MSDELARLLEAVSFAGRAHQGQLRKDGRTPYAAHPFRVCTIVRHVFGIDDSEMLTAALLHDTIEDTTTDCDDITEHFGPQVAGWVRTLTKDKRLPEDEREEAYVQALTTAGWQVQVLKLADIYDNLVDSKSLDAKRRTKSLARIRQYLDHIGAVIDERARAALSMVHKQLEVSMGVVRDRIRSS